jgi:hypothetical protein
LPSAKDFGVRNAGAVLDGLTFTATASLARIEIKAAPGRPSRFAVRLM